MKNLLWIGGNRRSDLVTHNRIHRRRFFHSESDLRVVAVSALEEVLLTTDTDLQRSLVRAGIPAGYRNLKDRSATPTFNSRSRELRRHVEETKRVLQEAEKLSGGLLAAREWFIDTPIPPLGHRTAGELVLRGEAAAVRAYIKHVESGGYA